MKIAAVLLFVGIIGLGVAGFLYWQSLKGTPQYSLALLVDAARRDDQAAVGELVDTDAVVDDLMPQIMDKAVELYGRGLPPAVIAKVSSVAQPLMPAVKERAKAELPKLIRDKTERFAGISFVSMVLGADRYLDIAIEGENATVKSKDPQHSVEVKMKRNGDRWKIVGVRDEKLATEIAQKIGQEIMALASASRSGGINPGNKNVQELIRKAQEIFK